MGVLFLEHKRKDFDCNDRLISKRQGDKVIYIAFEGDFYKISNHYNWLCQYDEIEISESEFNYHFLSAIDALGFVDAVTLCNKGIEKDNPLYINLSENEIMPKV